MTSKTSKLVYVASVSTGIVTCAFLNLMVGFSPLASFCFGWIGWGIARMVFGPMFLPNSKFQESLKNRNDIQASGKMKYYMSVMLAGMFFSLLLAVGANWLGCTATVSLIIYFIGATLFRVFIHRGFKLPFFTT